MTKPSHLKLVHSGRGSAALVAEHHLKKARAALDGVKTEELFKRGAGGKCQNTSHGS